MTLHRITVLKKQCLKSQKRETSAAFLVTLSSFAIASLFPYLRKLRSHLVVQKKKRSQIVPFEFVLLLLNEVCAWMNVCTVSHQFSHQLDIGFVHLKDFSFDQRTTTEDLIRPFQGKSASWQCEQARQPRNKFHVCSCRTNVSLLTSSILKLGSGEMTVRLEKSTRFPDKLPRNRPCLPLRR